MNTAKTFSTVLTGGFFDCFVLQSARTFFNGQEFDGAISLHRCLQHTKTHLRLEARRKDPATGVPRLRNQEFLPVLVEFLRWTVSWLTLGHQSIWLDAVLRWLRCLVLAAGCVSFLHALWLGRFSRVCCAGFVGRGHKTQYACDARCLASTLQGKRCAKPWTRGHFCATDSKQATQEDFIENLFDSVSEPAYEALRQWEADQLNLALQRSLEENEEHKREVEASNRLIDGRLRRAAKRTLSVLGYGNCQFSAVIESAKLAMSVGQLRSEVVKYLEPLGKMLREKIETTRFHEKWSLCLRHMEKIGLGVILSLCWPRHTFCVDPYERSEPQMQSTQIVGETRLQFLAPWTGILTRCFQRDLQKRTMQSRGLALGRTTRTHTNIINPWFNSFLQRVQARFLKRHLPKRIKT